MIPAPGLRTAPSLLAILVVAGTGVGAVVVTSLGLMPLYGLPERASPAGGTRRPTWCPQSARPS